MNFEPKIGDYVKLLKIKNCSGKIIKINKNNYYIEVRNILIKAKKEEICPAKEKNKIQSILKKNYNFQILELAEINNIIDLHGLTVKEAIEKTDKFIDTAIYKNIQLLKIIHGKGTGRLKKAIQKFLKNDKRINKIITDNFSFQGGTGVTIVEL